MGSMGLVCLPTWVVDLEENVDWIYQSHDLFGVRNALRKFVLNFFTRHFPQLSARNVSIHGCVSKLHAPSTLHTNYEAISQRVCTNPEISRDVFSFRSCIPGVIQVVTFWSPIVGGHLTFERVTKDHLKKVTSCQVTFGSEVLEVRRVSSKRGWYFWKATYHQWWAVEEDLWYLGSPSSTGMMNRNGWTTLKGIPSGKLTWKVKIHHEWGCISYWKMWWISPS